MKIPTPAPIARRFVSRSAVAGLLLAQSALTLFAQQTTPATAPAAADTNANAATGPVVQLETFNVTAGFRGSLAAAAQIKESMQGVSEIIAAEDIGKLPDVSIADSLTRVTGLTTQRTNGRSQGISIRGLTGDFSTGTLNGFVVGSVGTTTTISASANPTALGHSVTFTATVTSTGGTPNGGTVSFYDGTAIPANLIGTGNVSGGQASTSTSNLTLGSHLIKARFGK